MVGNDAEGDALLQHITVLVRGILRVEIHVGSAGDLLQLTEDGTEDIRAVVRHAAGEVREALGALHHGAGALEAHAGVHMPRGQVAEAAVAFGVVLNEHEVPDLDAAVAVLVHERALRVALRGEIHVQLGAGTAGAGFAHHPEVVVHVAVHHMHLRIHPLGGEQRSPSVIGLLVELPGVAGRLIRAVHSGVQTLHREAPAFHDQLPGPADGLFLEIIAEGPVAQHLEEGVVVAVLTHILQVIVLAAGTNALLRIRRTRRLPRWGPYPQEIRHKLVHAGIGKQ